MFYFPPITEYIIFRASKRIIDHKMPLTFMRGIDVLFDLDLKYLGPVSVVLCTA